MRHEVGPHPLSIIICTGIERARPEVPGTYTGITNQIQVKGKRGPRGGKLEPAPRLLVEARFAAGLARGSFRFGLSLQIGDAVPQIISEREIRLVDGRQEVRLARTWELKRLPTGPIWFDALVDDKVVMSVPFTVEVAPLPPDTLQA